MSKTEFNYNLMLVIITILVIAIICIPTYFVFKDNNDAPIEFVLYKNKNFTIANEDFFNLDNSYETSVIKDYQADINSTDNTYSIEKMYDESTKKSKNNRLTGKIGNKRKTNKGKPIPDTKGYYIFRLTEYGENCNKKHATIIIKHVIASKLGMNENDDEFNVFWKKEGKKILESYIDEKKQHCYIILHLILDIFMKKSGIIEYDHFNWQVKV